MKLSEKQKIFLTVIVAALGYFVDVFDLQLFTTVRVSSLKSLGLSLDQITIVGAQILNWQMAGMLLGGILWGVLGDKKGRTYALFGTILLYSIGNIANGFVTTIPAYAAARFFTGFGLAGEVGAGIALVSELLPKETRGVATTIVAVSGLVGSIAAAIIAKHFDWRLTYIGGGILGLLLLFLRIAVHESGIFEAVRQKDDVRRGHFAMLFNNRARFMRFFCCVAVALPVWFLLGTIVIFSPELGEALHVGGSVNTPTSVMFYSVGLTLGGFVSGSLSQYLKDRKKIMAVFILGAFLTALGITFAQNISLSAFYLLIAVSAFFTGFWAVFLAMTAEQFGTNLRATATVSAPNFVRASTIINTMLLTALKPEFGFVSSVRIIAILVFCVVFLALWKLPETFGRDLDFVEE